MITIDEERFKEVFGLIFSAYKARSHGFADTHADNLGPPKESTTQSVSRSVAGIICTGLHW